jgi:beta-N-acetylglucosaminidase
MNTWKKLVILMCLSSMMLGFNISSKNELTNKIDLNKVDEVKEELEKEKLKNRKVQKELALKKSEEDRISKVTYIREDITIKSGLNHYEMEKVLLNTTGAETMAHLAKAFIEAEQNYGVNAFFMAGIVALESGFATSRRAIEDNNLTGYEVYSDDSEGKLFPSQVESILHTAKHLKDNYLTEGALYYNGVSVDAVQIKYCPDEGLGKNWEGKVNELANLFLKTYNDLFKNKIQIAKDE